MLPPSGSTGSCPKSRARSAGPTRAEWRRIGVEQQRYDFIRLLRQAPAITELSSSTAAARSSSRYRGCEPDVVASQKDDSAEPQFAEAIADHLWFGPVYFRAGSEPYMTIALAQPGAMPASRSPRSISKLIWEVDHLDPGRGDRLRLHRDQARAADRPSRHQPRAARHRPVAAPAGCRNPHRRRCRRPAARRRLRHGARRARRSSPPMPRSRRSAGSCSCELPLTEALAPG